MLSERESSVARKLLLLPSISNEMMFLSDTIMGLTFKLCGEMGVITKLSLDGYRIGPPQLKL
jgi:hypothetical protein